MRAKLSKENYELLKQMDFSVINDEISFDDENLMFETDNELFDAVFDVNILAEGMDDSQEECNEYGKKLYALYDLLFFSQDG